MRRWLPISIIASAWIFSLAVFTRLPESMPVHWGISGDPNRYGSRIEGAFLLPFLMIGLYLIMQWYPSRDPRAPNIAKFRGAYDTVVAATLAFLAALHILAVGSTIGWNVNVTTVVLVGMGLLFVLLGNLLPLVRSNFIFGIRTPWTLSSETVWMRVHRVAGYARVAAGLITIACAFLARPLGVAIAVVSLLVSAAVPVVYSYILWSRERGGPSNRIP